MGLAKDRRIGDKKSFQRLFSRGRLLKGKTYWLRVLDNPFGHGRLAVHISKKQSPRAVDRHRLKRLCQEAFRKSTAWNSSKDYLLSLKTPLKESREVKSFLKKLGQDFERLD